MRDGEIHGYKQHAILSCLYLWVSPSPAAQRAAAKRMVVDPSFVSVLFVPSLWTPLPLSRTPLPFC